MKRGISLLALAFLVLLLNPTMSVHIRAQSQPPSLTLFNPQIDGLTVTINGVTMPGTPETQITSITWDWGDGYSEDHWFPATHTYDSGGSYTVTVVSYQSDGLSTTRSVTVTVSGGQPSQPPNLSLFSPEVDELTVRVNGVTTPGTSGATITRIHWDWGDGRSEDHWFPASHTYGSGGTYTIEVTAYQSDGFSTTESVRVTLQEPRPERLEITYVNYPRSVRTGESFVVDLEVAYALRGPTDVVVELYEHGGPLVTSKRRVLSGDGSEVFDLSVTAPSTPRRWQLNIHLQGEFKQSIYIDVGQPCQPPSLNLFTPEVDGLKVRVNGVTMPGCSDAKVTHVYWEWGDGQSGDYWFPASHTYGSRGTYTIEVTSYQSDGQSTTRSVTVTVSSLPPPVCSEGAVNVLEMCSDGSTWRHRQVCRNNAWVDEYQQCPAPPVCSEGAVNVLETCPDGSWSHRQVCRNNAWHDEYQQCPAGLPSDVTARMKGSITARLQAYQSLRELFDPNTHINKAVDDLTSLRTAVAEQFMPSWKDLIPGLDDDLIAFSDLIDQTRESFSLLSESQEAWDWSTIDAWLYPTVHSDPALQGLTSCTGSYAVCQIDRIVGLINQENDALNRGDTQALKNILSQELREETAFQALLQHYRDRGSQQDMGVQKSDFCWLYGFIPWWCSTTEYPIRDASDLASSLVTADAACVKYVNSSFH